MDKKCDNCNENKPATDFHRKRNSPDGLTSCCKACRLEYFKTRSENRKKEPTIMNKFYVQSGSLKEVLMAREPFEACVRALDRTFDEDLELAPCFVVSQRGFVMDREPTKISTNEEIYSSQDIMEEYSRTHPDI